MNTVVYSTNVGALEAESTYQNGVWAVYMNLKGSFSLVHIPSGGCPGFHAREMPPPSDDAINLCRLLGRNYPDFGKDCAFDDKPETAEKRAEVELFIKKTLFGMRAGLSSNHP